MENQKTVYINFYDAIDLVKVNKFILFTTDLINKHNPTELYYFFSSKGGDVDAGFTLYNFLVSLQSKLIVTIHNIGTVDSIANIIFVAAQKRYAAPNASFLFHGISLNFNAAPQGRTAIKENLSMLDGMESRMAATLTKNTKMTEEEIKILFHQGEGKDVKFALEKGIISEIKTPSIPKGELHFAMSFV